MRCINLYVKSVLLCCLFSLVSPHLSAGSTHKTANNSTAAPLPIKSQYSFGLGLQNFNSRGSLDTIIGPSTQYDKALTVGKRVTDNLIVKGTINLNRLNSGSVELTYAPTVAQAHPLLSQSRAMIGISRSNQGDLGVHIGVGSDIYLTRNFWLNWDFRLVGVPAALSATRTWKRLGSHFYHSSSIGLSYHL